MVSNVINIRPESEGKNVSEFEKILNSFDGKLQRLENLSTQIGEKVTIMIDYEKNPSDEKATGISGALVGEFEKRLNTIHLVNNHLEEILMNLTRLIG